MDNIHDIKRQMIKMIIENDKIFQLIDNKNIEVPDDLLGTSIFPYLRIDGTNLDVGTYIGFKIDYPNISINNTVKNITLTFMIYCHNDCLLYKNTDARTDLIAEELINIFNFHSDIAFNKLELTNSVENPYNTDYYSRQLVFKSKSLNSIENKLNI